MFGYYYDYTYFLFMLPALIISIYAQIKVQSTFKKYSKINNNRNLTGAMAAEKVLIEHGITNVRVEHVPGNLSDHFDPRDNVIRLSDSVYNNTSVAAVGVAAHEAGHAVQHAQGYFPIKIRSFLIPITNLGSWLSFPLIFLGFIFPNYGILLKLGILFFSFTFLFQLVTLPVEFDASKRAIATLEQSHMLYEDEVDGAKSVLKAAALTYLAATLAALLSLLRLILISGGNRSGDE